MAEGFELVRTLRQHLRRGAILLDEGRFDDALGDADAALALDPQSLPAQALRDRITRLKHLSAPPAIERPAVPVTPAPFVPQGVNAASWRGFEQRIQERRFRALIETVNTSIVAGNATGARVALEEARELRPDAPELDAFEARVAAVPAATPVREATPGTRIWVRAMGAAALLLIGVSMLIGLEWMRPSETIAPMPISAPAPIVIPAEDLRVAEGPEPAPPAEPTIDDDDFVPAIITPPEPTLRPRGTTGTTGTFTPAITSVSGPIAFNQPLNRPLSQPPAVLIERRAVVDEPPLRPVGEVPDDYVAQPLGNRAAAASDADLMRSPVAPVRMPPSTAPPVVTAAALPTPAPATVASAVNLSPGEQSRVEDVLRRYARAYDSLDASAARAVWPSVNEKQLAKAFQDLASQNVSFDSCDIDIRGAVANASCRGQQSYVGKVGDRAPRTEPRTWRFELRRDGEAWKIENAETRRQSTPSTEYRDQ
jgi:tetratricopeptide (TPR) repeat protein